MSHQTVVLVVSFLALLAFIGAMLGLIIQGWLESRKGKDRD